MKLILDRKEVEVSEGKSVLQACLENDIYIPHVCFLPEIRDNGASCRLCMVQIDGCSSPQSACSVSIEEGMVVQTNTSRVRQLQKKAFHLLLSTHDVACGTCEANGVCELQKIAKFLQVKLSNDRVAKYLKEPAIDTKHPCAIYYVNRCVLCARCLAACEKAQGSAQFSFSHRGINMRLSFIGMDSSICDNCSKICLQSCPTGALVHKKED